MQSAQQRFLRKIRMAALAALMAVSCIAVALPATRTANAAWSGSPKLIRVSDEVKPGEAFSINGNGITDDANLDVAVALDTAGTSPSTPPAGALHPAIIQRDRNGYYAVATMPSTATAGVYNVWVKNGSGWSAPLKLNGPRPLYISEYEGFNGTSVQMAGRNLDSAVFGASSATYVRLNNGSGGMYELPISSENPYALTFSINNNPPAGSYFVEVSNDARTNWIRLNNEDNQKLNVVVKPTGTYDPLGLGVVWAKNFNWGSVFNVSSYGVAPNTGADVTTGVQNAIDAAGGAGGGVVYFADGTYKIGNIALPEGVVLQGQSMNNTILQYYGSGGFVFIGQKGSGVNNGRMGIATLTIKLPTGYAYRPDIYIGWGGPGFNDTTLRTSKEMFVKNVKLVDSLTSEPTVSGQRGLPLLVTAKERVLVADSDFTAFQSASFNYINQYVAFKNNVFHYTQGDYIILSNYTFIENNQLIGYTAINREKHGFMVRANVYLANNTITGMGSYPGTGNPNYNDGEAIASEVPAGYFNYGTVSSATNTSISVTAHTTLTFPAAEYNRVSVMIVDGTGLGQLRKVSSISGSTINIAKAWTINPDNTSKFTLITPNENITMYQNSITNNTKGYYLFGNSYDGVVADNTSTDSEGVYIWTVHNAAENGFIPGYFNAVNRNIVTGVSPKSQHAGVGFGAGRFDGVTGAYYAVQAYGNEFSDNTITGVPSAVPVSGSTEAPPLSGVFVSSAKYSSQYDGLNVTGDGTNTIVEHNTLSSLNTGVTLTRANYGQVVVNNVACSAVTTLLDNGDGAQNTYSANNGCPTAPATAFVTGQTVDTARNNYTGNVGMKFTVGASAITVKELGRWVVSGNSGTHTIKIVSAATGADVASVSLNTSGKSVGFNYVTLGSPVTLSAGASYYLVSAETNGGDQWYNSTTSVSTTAVATVNNPIFSLGDGSYVPDGSTANRTFGPVSFKY